MNKAQKVEQTYDVAKWQDNTSSEGCYSLAVHTALELGGVEVGNSNNNNRAVSFAPTRTFKFDDGSATYILYGGVYVIEYSA